MVGAGPAGSATARAASDQGVSVLVLEKKRDIGVPVRCAEGVSELGLKNLIEVDDSWIAQVITKSKFVSPDGTEVMSFPGEKGLILHRKIFDLALAGKAVSAGAQLLTRAYVSGVVRKNNQITGVKVERMGEEKVVNASVVIGADGIESQISRWAGINIMRKKSYILPCFQMLLANIDIDPECVEFYLGNSIAPGGYVWVFPKGDGIANVGLGIDSGETKRKNALGYLNAFIEKKYPHSSILSMTAGAVTSGPSPSKIVGNGFMLVGDAAFQINPFTGGGIINSMIAGDIAGTVAAEAVNEGNVSAKRLEEYQKKWYKKEGKNNDRSYKIKKVVSQFSDMDFNKIAKLLLPIPPEKRSGYQIFKKVLFKHPKLIYNAAKVFGIK
ncbi:MAG: NAD(P)/FAD-dependent oxidoreductase [bacterium]